MLPRKLRVLLVDDDADTCEMYSWSLEVRGFAVFTVSNAISALAEAGTEPPDVIITDYTLPGFDGLALAEKLKASPFTADVPIVLLSGHSLESEQLNHARELCARVLLKPVLPDNLADAITTVLVDATAARLAAQIGRVRRRLQGANIQDPAGAMAAIDAEVGQGPHPSAALLANDEGHYVSANDAATDMTGRTREQLLALSVWDLTPNMNVAHGRRMWHDFIACGSMHGTYEVVGPDGEHLTMWFTAVANVVQGQHLSLLAVLPPGASYPAAA